MADGSLSGSTIGVVLLLWLMPFYTIFILLMHPFGLLTCSTTQTAGTLAKPTLTFQPLYDTLWKISIFLSLLRMTLSDGINRRLEFSLRNLLTLSYMMSCTSQPIAIRIGAGVQNRLATNYLRCSRKISESATCPICLVGEETVP
ncbi:hypothetical protein OROMI_032828 [Orobanche minor]